MNSLDRHILLFAALLLLLPFAAAADRAGWNEPGRQPGYDQNSLLRINSDYFKLSAATGGDFYFWAPGEFARSAGILNVPMAQEAITLHYSSEAGSFMHQVDVPVDSTISQLNIFSGAQRLDSLTVYRPDGRDLVSNPAGVSSQSFTHMHLVSVIDPEPGLWQIEINGAGFFELAARYMTDRNRLKEMEVAGIELIDFAFVELRGRPGHQGLFPVEELPEAGTQQTCQLTLSGSPGPPRTELISETGETLDTINLASSPDSASGEFIGDCVVPDQPFRVKATGNGPLGFPYQRLTSGLNTLYRP